VVSISGSLPFTTPDGAQYTGFGGLRGQGGGGSRNLLPTVPRNFNTGSPNYRLDLRLARDIQITERAKAEILFEGFNVFNRANYNGFLTTSVNAAATTTTTALNTPVVLTPNPTFGTVTDDGSQPDGTNARRLQVALRFRF
jgi:hypothetical protein